MQLTSNLNLKKPEATDNVNIDDLNENADILDAAVAGKVDKVSGKGLSTNDYTSTEKTKLTGIATGAQVNTVTSVAGKTGVISLAKADVGLGNVDNTADLDKPVSTAQQTALNNKVNVADVVLPYGSVSLTTALTNFPYGTSVANLASGYTLTTFRGTKGGNPTDDYGYQVLFFDPHDPYDAPTHSFRAWSSAALVWGMLNDYATSEFVSSQIAFSEYLQSLDYIRQPGFGTTAGTGTAYTLTLEPPLATYADGVCVAVKIHVANTGSATLNVDGRGARTLRKANGTTFTAGQLRLNTVYTFRLSGSDFILQGEGGEYGTAAAAQVRQGYTIGTGSGIVSGTLPQLSADINASGWGYAPALPGIQVDLPNNVFTASGYKIQVTDPDMIPGNIVHGINILGCTGTLKDFAWNGAAPIVNADEGTLFSAGGGSHNTATEKTIHEVVCHVSGTIQCRIVGFLKNGAGPQIGIWSLYKNGTLVGSRQTGAEIDVNLFDIEVLRGDILRTGLRLNAAPSPIGQSVVFSGLRFSGRRVPINANPGTNSFMTVV